MCVCICMCVHLVCVCVCVCVCVRMSVCVCVCEGVRERIMVCFRLRGSSCLFCSVFSSRRLCDEDWEKLCLGAVGGLTLAGLIHPFKTTFFQRLSTWMTSSSTLQQQRWWEKNINIFFYWKQYENWRFFYRKTSFSDTVWSQPNTQQHLSKLNTLKIKMKTKRINFILDVFCCLSTFLTVGTFHFQKEAFVNIFSFFLKWQCPLHSLSFYFQYNWQYCYKNQCIVCMG